MTEFFVIADGATAPAQVKTAVETGKTAATAQPEAAKKPQGPMDGLMGMLPILLIFGAMFYLMWRGQAKEKKRRQQMLESIKNGDKVMTAGGIYGTIANIRDDSYLVKIADNVKIEVSKSAIGQVIKNETENKDGKESK